MKRTLFGLVVAMALFAKADDSYLYWMVSSDPGFTYTSAQLIATTGDKPWSSGSKEVETVNKDTLDTARSFGDGLYSNVSSSLSGYTYFIELLNGSKVVAYSSGLAYASASAYLSSLTQFDPGADSLWTPSFQTIPEPTSGMMMLLGMAALALRRRRRA